MSRLITAELVEARFAAGEKRIRAPRGETIVTPNAWSKAWELGVTIEQEEESGSTRPAPAAAPAPQDPGSCQRVVDPSGLIVVRGRSVRLGKFTGAGSDKNIGLTDLITGQDRSPMTAGIMSWGRADSFDWKLDYDEVDLVLEGTLQIGVDGRVLEGCPGDVFYIPKGSRIRFGTPDRARVFYVTYPADWASASGKTPG